MPDTLMRVPRTSIVSFQPSLGPDRGRGFVRGAKTGALVGGMIGLAVLLVGVLSDAGAPCHDCVISASMIGGVFAVATTAGGTLIGAALGAAGAPDRWGGAELVGSAEHYRRSRQLALRLSVAR
jgi:hypothetical protein